MVLDLNLPGLDGLSLQQELVDLNLRLPVVFLSGWGDVPSSVNALKRGAIDFLTKPVEDEVLIGAVREALARDEERRRVEAELDEMRARLNLLTLRERVVLAQVLTGRMNKQIAAELRIGEKTIKLHRSRFMRKLGLTSVPELIRFAARLGVKPAPGSR